jgi:peptidoglycan/LPS O-acetylase OafA/YrhL
MPAPDGGPWPTDRGARLAYLPGLDGLRALAVAAVLAYHGGYGGLPGGFLGVEVFLVISGYLITALLVSERAATGRVSLRDFFVRRARRLLPAVGVLLVVVTAVSVVALPDTLAALRGDVVSALLYVQNWHQIVADQSYFEAVGRPPLLRHLWSLAVEEQFYLVWPLLFAAGIKFLGRKRLVVGVAVGAVASALWMAVLFTPGVDPTRVYYGTDTRASGLLIGVALALVLPPWRMRAAVGAAARVVLDAAGVVALVGLVAIMATVGEFSAVLYRGGFFATGLLTAVLIAVVAHPAARLGTVLGVAPLRWIGLRSYGIYLWHWPVFMLTRPGVDVGWPGWLVVAVRLGLTVGIAELSYRYVEMPVRRGALGRGWARLRNVADPADVVWRNRVIAYGLAGVLVVGLLGGALVRAEPAGPPPWFVAVSAGVGPDVEVTGVLSLLPAPLAAAIVAAQTAPDPGPAAPGAGSAAADPALPPLVPGRVTMLGDSVMLGAIDDLGSAVTAEVTVDAAVSRQVDAGLSLLRLWRDTGYLGDVAVVHLGNNGIFTDEQFDEMMEILAGVPRVVVVTTRNTYTWQDSVNDVIARGAQRHPTVVVADWHAVSDPNRDWFWDDGMHVRPEGAEAYAGVVARAVSGGS